MNNSYKMNISFGLDFSDIPDMKPENQDDLPIVVENLRDWFKDWQLHYLRDIMEWTAKGRDDLVAIKRARLSLVEQIFNNFVVDGTFGNGDKYHYESSSPGYYEKLIVNDVLVSHTDKDGITKI